MSTTDDLETGNAPESGGWKFDAAVADAFDDMLSRSVPWIDVMRKVVTDAACWFADQWGEGATIVDLGSSRGSALAPIVDRLGARARYCAYEISDPMLEILRDRFDGWVRSIGGQKAPMAIQKHDLRKGYPHGHPPAAAILSVLTLQFVPIEYRATILRGIYDALGPGGALIIVEKVMGEAAETDKLLTSLYWDLKHHAGYSHEAIQRKALSLEGVLVPLTGSFNEQLFARAGFSPIECVWAWCNFRAWVCLKR